VSVGTGGEAGVLSFDANTTSSDYTYTGWEIVRLGAGYDFRTTAGMGWGPYASLGFTRFTELEGPGSTTSLSPGRIHTWAQVGVRLILNP